MLPRWEQPRRAYRGDVKGVDAALVPLVASLAAWGVEEAHWLPDHEGSPVIWVRVRTAKQRLALESQPWLVAQLQVTLARVGVPHEEARSARVLVSSAEDEALLFEE
jgi:hypothetical protein